MDDLLSMYDTTVKSTSHLRREKIITSFFSFFNWIVKEAAWKRLLFDTMDSMPLFTLIFQGINSYTPRKFLTTQKSLILMCLCVCLKSLASKVKELFGSLIFKYINYKQTYCVFNISVGLNNISLSTYFDNMYSVLQVNVLGSTRINERLH